MNGVDLVTRLDELGVELTLSGDRVRYRSPAGALAPELLAEMKQNRDELVAILTARERLAWPPARASDTDGQRTGPLTVSQRSLWATSHVVTDGTFNLCGALRLRGTLDRAAFVAALGDVHRRHASLRTIFPAEHGEPRQVILEDAEVPLAEHDLSRLPTEVALGECLQECASVADRLLALDAAPPVRMSLYRLDEDDHVFFVVLHHVIADGVSFQILIADLMRRYNARRDGAAAPVRPIEPDLLDYAVWEERYLRSGDLSATRRYWREALHDCPTDPVPLPVPSPESGPARGSAHSIEIDADLTAAVRETAASARASAFVVVAAVVAAALRALTGRDDMVVGMPVARRDLDGLADLVGLLLDTVPVRLDLRDEPTFAEAVGRVRTAVLGALIHRFPPSLAAEGRTGANRAGRELFNILVTDAGAPLTPTGFTGLHASEVEIEQVGAKFDLNFLVRDLGDVLRVDIEFDRAAITGAAVSTLAGSIVRVLTAGTADPRRAMAPPAAVRSSVIAENPAQTVAGPAAEADADVVERLRDLYRRALSDGSRLANLDRLGHDDDAADFFDLGGDSMRAIKLLSLAQESGLEFTLRDIYAHPELRDLASRVVRHAGPDEGLASPTAFAGSASPAPFALVPPAHATTFGPDVVDAYPMTALQLGMVYHQEVAPQARVYHNLLSVRVRGSMRPEAFHAAVQDLAARHPVLRTSFDPGHAAGPMQRVHERVKVPVRFEDVTALSAEAQERRVEAVLAEERATDFPSDSAPLLRFVVLTRSADEYQLVFSHHHILLDGWSVNILFDDLHHLYRRALGDDRPALPALRGRLADYVAAEQAALADPAERDYWARITATDAKLLTTPTTVPPVMRRMSIGFPAGTIARLRPVAQLAGTPLKGLLLAAHTRVLSWLLGADDVVTGLVLTCRPATPDADRVLGLFLNELPMYTRLGDPSWIELAQQVHSVEMSMTNHRWYPHAAVLKQRGQGALFDSYFNFTDFHTTKRLLEQELQLLDAMELEFTHYAMGVNFTVDLRSHELRLILEYDSTRLERSSVLLAAEAYRRTLTAIVADPAASCRQVSLPGVLDLARLGDLVDVDDQPVFDAVGAVAAAVQTPVEEPPASTGRPPRTPLEESVQQTWVEVLGPGEYAADANFFTVGGDSLTAMRVVSRLRARHGQFSMGAFISAPTIEAAAAVLAAAPADPPAVVAVGRPHGPRRFPVSRTQHQLWLLATRMAQLPLFGVSGTFRIDGPVDLDALRGAFAALVARHDALRTRFEAAGTGVEQVVEPDAGIGVDVVDVSGHDDPLAACEQRMAVAARQPFALDTAPLMRVAAYRIGDEAYVVHLHLHHIVCDGWSMALMQRELTDSYLEIKNGSPRQRPAPAGAAALISGRIAWSRSAAADEQRGFWTTQLAPPWPLLSDPAESPIKPVGRLSLIESLTFRSCRRTVDAATAETLRMAGAVHGHTEFMLLVAAYAAALASRTGQRDIRIGTMVAGRGDPGAEDVIGLLVNTVVLRLRVDQPADAVALSRQAHEVCAAAYGRQELAFEDVLESLTASGEAGQLFEAMLLQQDELTGATVDGLRLSAYQPKDGLLTNTLSPSAATLMLAATTGPSGIDLTLRFKPTAVAPEAARELVDAVAEQLVALARELHEQL
ncbi:condensation domain-containing protein [Micromonospora sp. NPDC047467]|uniref:condensation domain-containing protein n=1 Tax=Micromonospora sp. NPDC047467 TaxID=3154814 RepID=UPI0033F0EC2C